MAHNRQQSGFLYYLPVIKAKERIVYIEPSNPHHASPPPYAAPEATPVEAPLDGSPPNYYAPPPPPANDVAPQQFAVIAPPGYEPAPPAYQQAQDGPQLFPARRSRLANPRFIANLNARRSLPVKAR